MQMWATTWERQPEVNNPRKGHEGVGSAPVNLFSTSSSIEMGPVGNDGFVVVATQLLCYTALK